MKGLLTNRPPPFFIFLFCQLLPTYKLSPKMRPERVKSSMCFLPDMSDV